MPKLSRYQRHHFRLLRKGRRRASYFCTWCRRKHWTRSKIGRVHMKFKGVSDRKLFFCPRDGSLLRREQDVKRLHCSYLGCTFRGKYVRRGKRVILKEVRG